MFGDFFHIDNKFNTSNTKCIQHCLGLHLYLGRRWIQFLCSSWYV